jgi:hypothetical protein
MILEKSGGRRLAANGNVSAVPENRLGMSTIPGISQIMPPSAGVSAKIRGGMGFGLGGLGATTTDVYGNPIIDPSTGSPTSDVSVIGDLIQRGITALNSEQVFQLNLSRLQQGLPPISPSLAAPTINVGLAGIPNQVLLAGAALLAFLIFTKRNGHTH